MPSLEDHFRALTGVRPPDTWPDLGPLEPGSMHRPPRWPRRLAVGAIALLVAAGGLFLATRALRERTPSFPATSGRPSTTPSEPTPTESASPAWTPRGGVFGAMVDAIRSSSPSGYTFSFTHDRLDGDWRLDGNADDGSGPGRLYVDVTARPGNFEADPCSDPEFVMGARCIDKPLSNGDLLVLRDIVVDPGGMKTIEVVLVHPDRSGIGSEAGNWRAPTLPSGPVSQGQLSSPEVTRSDPPYTVEELGRLVLAIDHRIRDCLRTSCA